MPKTACPVVWEGPGAQSLVTRPDKKILTQIGKRHHDRRFPQQGREGRKDRTVWIRGGSVQDQTFVAFVALL
jgi:hypothetical protein